MTEVDDHFGDAGFQVLHRLEIKISPFVCTNGGTSDDHRIQNDVLLRENGEKLSGNAGKPYRQKREFVVMSGFDAEDRKSTRLNSSHITISYAVFCLKKKK